MDFLKAELRRLTAEEEERKRAYHGGRADLQEIWDKLVSLRMFINKFETEIESAKIEDIMRGVGSVDAINYILPSRNTGSSMTVNSANRVADINKLKEKLRMKEVIKSRVAVLEEKIVDGRRHLAKCSDAMKQGAVNYTLSTEQYNLLFMNSTLSSGVLSSPNAGSVAKNVALRQALLTISGRVNSWEDELLKSNNELKLLEADLSRDISDATLTSQQDTSFFVTNASSGVSQQGYGQITPAKSGMHSDSVYSTARKTLSNAAACNTDDAVLDIITHGAPLSSDLINALRQGADTVFDASSNRTAATAGMSLSDCEFSLYEVMSGQAGVTRMNGESPKMYIMRLQKRLGSLLTLELQIQLEFQAKVAEVKHNRDLLREVEIKRLRVELQVSNVQQTLQHSQMNHAINMQYHNNLHSTGDSFSNLTLIENTPGPSAAHPVLSQQQQSPYYRTGSAMVTMDPYVEDHRLNTNNTMARSPSDSPHNGSGKREKGSRKIQSPNNRGDHRDKANLRTRRAAPPVQVSTITSTSSGPKALTTPSANAGPAAATTTGITTSRSTTYQESVYHAGIILGDIMQHQSRRFAVLEDCAQEMSFFSPDTGKASSSSAVNSHYSAGKSPSTKEIHRLIMQYMDDHRLDPHVHYAGIIKAIKIQVLSQLLQRDLSNAEVAATAHLISVSSPTPAAGGAGSNRLHRYFTAADTPISPIPLPAEYTQYAAKDAPRSHHYQEEGRSQQQRRSTVGPPHAPPLDRQGSPQTRNRAAAGGVGGGGADSGEGGDDDSDMEEETSEQGGERSGSPHRHQQHQAGPKRSTSPKKFPYPNARKATSGGGASGGSGNKKMWVSALHVEPKADVFLSPQPDRLQRLAAKALQSAVSGLSEVYREDGNDFLGSTLTSSGTGSGDRGGDGGGGGSGNKSRSGSHKLKHHRSVRRNCSCDSCRAASIQGESTDDYDYQTRYDRHGHRVSSETGAEHSVTSESENPRSSQEHPRMLDTVDESPRSSLSTKGSPRSSFLSPEKASSESQASVEKGRRLTRNAMNVSFRSDVDMLREVAQASDADVNISLLGPDSPVPDDPHASATATSATSALATMATPVKRSVFDEDMAPLISRAPSFCTNRNKEKAASGSSSAMSTAAAGRQTAVVRRPRVDPSVSSEAEDSSPRAYDSATDQRLGGQQEDHSRDKPARGRKSHPPPAASAKIAADLPRFTTSMKTASPARAAKPSGANHSETEGGTPPHFRFCTICSTLVSPHGTSSAAFTGGAKAGRGGLHGVACAHLSHQKTPDMNEPTAAASSATTTTAAAVGGGEGVNSERGRDISSQNLPTEVNVDMEEAAVPHTQVVAAAGSAGRSASPLRPESLPSSGINTSTGRFLHAQQQVNVGDDDNVGGGSKRDTNELPGSPVSPVRRLPATGPDFSALDSRLSGLTLRPHSAVKQPQHQNVEDTSEFDHNSVLPGSPACFPPPQSLQHHRNADTFVETPSNRSGLRDLQDLMDRLAQQQKEIDELRQSHNLNQSYRNMQSKSKGTHTSNVGGSSSAGAVGHAAASTAASTSFQPALFRSANLNLGSPHLKVAGSSVHSHKLNATDQLQEQLSVSKPRLGGNTAHFNGNMTPSSTIRSADTHRGRNDPPLSAPTSANLGAHSVSRRNRESQGPHGLPHEPTPLLTLPSEQQQGLNPAPASAPALPYHTHEFSSPTRYSLQQKEELRANKNLSQLAEVSPLRFQSGESPHPHLQRYYQGQPPQSQLNQPYQQHEQLNQPYQQHEQLNQPYQHQEGVSTARNHQSDFPHGRAPYPSAAARGVYHQQTHLTSTPAAIISAAVNQYAPSLPPQPLSHASAPVVAQAHVPDSTDATVQQILRCLRERIAKLQHRYQQACSHERIHPQYKIALNEDGSSKAYADVSIISVRNLPIMKRQQKSCDAYIELQLITQFPTPLQAPPEQPVHPLHAMRVDTSAFLSGQVYNRLDLLYQAHNYAQLGWPAEGVNAHLLDTKVDVVDQGVQFNAYGRTTVKEGTVFPEWRESFKFPSLSYIPSQSVVLIVKDATYAAHHQVDVDDSVVGFAVLPLSATLLVDQHPHTMWLPLQKPPQMKHSSVHKLPENCALKVEVKVHFSEQAYWRHLLSEAELILHKVTSSLTGGHNNNHNSSAEAASSSSSNLTAAEGRRLEKWLDAMPIGAPAPASALALTPAPTTAVVRHVNAPPPLPFSQVQSQAPPWSYQMAEHSSIAAADASHDHQNNVHHHRQQPVPINATAQLAQSPVAFQGHVPLEQRPHHLKYAQAVHNQHTDADVRQTAPSLSFTLSEPSQLGLTHQNQDQGQKQQQEHMPKYYHDHLQQQPSGTGYLCDEQPAAQQEELLSPMAFSAISSVTNSPMAPASYQQQRGTSRFFTHDTPGLKRQNLYPATPLANYPTSGDRSNSRTKKYGATNEAQADVSRSNSAHKGRLKIVGLREQSNRDVFLKTLRSDTTSAKKTTSKPRGGTAVPLPAELFRTPVAAASITQQPSTDHHMDNSSSAAFAPPPLPVQLQGRSQQGLHQSQQRATHASGVKPATKRAPHPPPPPLPVQTQAASSTATPAPAGQPRVDLSIFKRAGTDMVYQGEVRSDVGNKLFRSALSRNEKLGFLSAGPKLLNF